MHLPTSRVLGVLRLTVCDGKQRRLSDYSRELDIPKSTLLPILRALCEERYLSLDKNGYYSVGSALFSLATEFYAGMPILGDIHSRLDRIVEEFGFASYFGCLSDGYVLYLAKAEPQPALRTLTNPGEQLPAYASSIGKALLMDKSVEELRALYPDGLSPLTPNTITDIQILYDQLSSARYAGYTWECEESTEHIRCFAVPVYKRRKLVAAVSAAIPTYRFKHDQQGAIISALRSAAEQMAILMERTDAHFAGLF